MSTVTDLPVHGPVTESNPKQFTTVEPECPLCGGRIKDTYEDTPVDLDSHYVNGSCEDCNLRVTIEYRAIDVSFETDVALHARQSGVSHGLLSPSDRDYVESSEFEAFPSATELRSVDWPVECDECNETLPANLIQEVDTESDPTEAALTCPHCEYENTLTFEPESQ